MAANDGFRPEWAQKDFYAVLGVKKDAAIADIKKAYRKLARENHPDSNPDDTAKHERFKAVAEAYDVVGDAEHRQQYDEMRRLYASTPDAQIRGYDAGRFSFNTAKGGRCPTCEGQGVISHEMAFLPDAVTVCEACGGGRFEPATLDVQYNGRSIGDVLGMTAEEAVELFANHLKIRAPLATMCDLGVGYLHLGQGSHTLSGGEAQRLKLASELTAGLRPKPTLYVLDEPTTGLHLADVARLLDVLDRLVERGDTLVIVEHHPAVIARADHIIELGPEGGSGGGQLVAEGTPREIAKKKTATGKVLKELFGRVG